MKRMKRLASDYGDVFLILILLGLVLMVAGLIAMSAHSLGGII